MKIRHPWALRAAGQIGGRLLSAWMRTLHFQYQPLGPHLDPHNPQLDGRYIYAMWHEYLLLPVCCFAHPKVHVLISQHADGQLVAELCRYLGVPVIRGSSTRGGVPALRQLIRAAGDTHIALTPDGPRGPRQRVKPGLIYLAAQTGLPIVPVGFGLQRPRRARSWDCFAVPRLGSRARCVTDAPIIVPPDADGVELERCRLQVEEALVGLTTLAEDWAENNVLPVALPARVPVALPVAG